MVFQASTLDFFSTSAFIFLVFAKKHKSISIYYNCAIYIWETGIDWIIAKFHFLTFSLFTRRHFCYFVRSSKTNFRSRQILN